MSLQRFLVLQLQEMSLQRFLVLNDLENNMPKVYQNPPMPKVYQNPPMPKVYQNPPIRKSKNIGKKKWLSRKLLLVA